MRSHATQELEKIRVMLIQNGHCSETWLSQTLMLAELFGRTSPAQHRAMIAEFHNRIGGGRLPLMGEREVGALILEAQADLLRDVGVKEFLYTEAKFRAVWCAQRATAAGEGLARSLHVRELDDKITRLKAPSAF